jgi:hypothetical protein
MGFGSRVQFALIATIVDMVMAIVHYRIGVAYLYPTARNHPGPFSPLIGQLEAVIPLVLMLGLLFPWAYVVYGAVQDERSVQRRRV